MALALLAVVPLLQGIWTVDASGGGQFYELNEAIAVAAPGDVILVAPGHYYPLITTKRVTILGPTGDMPAHVWGHSSVRDTDGMTIAGMTFDALRFVDVTGPIRLEDVRVVDAWPYETQITLYFERCSHVTATRVHVSSVQCGQQGFPRHAIRVIDSTLHLASSFARGGKGCGELAEGGSGLFAEGASTVVVSATTLIGGGGGGGPCSPPPTPCYLGQQGYGIRAHGNARVFVRGRGETIEGPGPTSFAVSASSVPQILRVFIADGVPVVGLITPGVLLVPVLEPHLGLDPMIGGTPHDRELRIDGPAGAIGWVFASTSTHPFPLPGLTLPVLVDPSAILWSHVIQTDGIAPRWKPFVSPPVSGGLTGLVVTFQAVFPDVPATPGTSGLFLTNAVDWILRP